MKFVPAAEDTEILSDPTARDDARRARQRMDACIAPSDEVFLWEYNSNGARRNKLPGIPYDD